MADKQTETKMETAASAVEDSFVANFDELKKNYGSKAGDLYHQIANIAGFGSHGRDHIGADSKPDFPVLDYSGASTDAKSAIAKLLKEGK